VAAAPTPANVLTESRRNRLRLSDVFLLLLTLIASPIAFMCRTCFILVVRAHNRWRYKRNVTGWRSFSITPKG